MRYRPLGASGQRVSELFPGAMTFADGFAYGADHGEAQRIVDAYAEADGNVIDTAVNYRDGASEQIVGGRPRRGKRNPAPAMGADRCAER
jgi:aryl-alcohol dehydrogenase-like predicted oxidoreductase